MKKQITSSVYYLILALSFIHVGCEALELVTDEIKQISKDAKALEEAERAKEAAAKAQEKEIKQQLYAEADFQARKSSNSRERNSPQKHTGRHSKPRENLQSAVIPTPTSDFTNKWIYIRAQHSGKYLDVSGNSQDDRAQLIQWPLHGGKNQQFKLVSAADPDYVHIQARHSGKYLDVSGNSQDDGAQLIQWPLHGGKNQQFALILPDKPPANTVWLYQHVNYQGKLMEASANIAWIGNEFNDLVSSVRVGPSAEVTLYEHKDYKGKTLTVRKDTPDLRKRGFNDKMSSLKIISLLPYIYGSLQGGAGGADFRDTPPDGSHLRKVAIRHGWGVDAIQVTYKRLNGSDQTLNRHGGGGGDLSQFELNQGEYLTKIEGKQGSFIGSLTFYTNTGKKYGPYGTAQGQWSGDSFTITAPSDHEIIGFYGKSGTHVNSIGILVRKQ